MRSKLRWVASLALCAGVVVWSGFESAPGAPAAKAAKEKPATGQAGARKPKKKPARKFKRPVQTKRVGQGQMIAIVDGKLDRAARMCEDYLELEPNHLESLFNLAVARGQMKDLAGAEKAMQQALGAGLPAGRFLAGPRRLVKPLAQTETFRRLAAREDLQLIHGPMLGCLTDRSARFWVRTAKEIPVQVVVSASKDMARPIKSPAVSTAAGHDYTAVAGVQGLEPDTVYWYDVLLDGRSALGPDRPSFRTFPRQGEGARFRVAFGGGAGYTPKHERMWETIAARRPLAFLFLGDNVYIDNPTRPQVQQYTYYRRQSRPEYRRFVRSTAIFAIWDDHDFGVNDCFYGADRDKPPWKVPVWELFRDNWNNPVYGGGPKNPGCWFRFAIGDVDFFMLDGRYYRTDPQGESPSMLGAVQKAWLLEGLKSSRAAFKVLASPVPWVLEAKGKSLDTWRGFQAEREEIFAFIQKHRIDGVVLLSADRHRSDVWRIDRPEGYPLWEFESSRLTNVHSHGLMPGAVFGYNKKCSFGLLEFDTAKADPELTYRIESIDGEPIHAVTVKRSAISQR